ncbi:MAG: hypothetical protein QOI67_274 [Gaiellaceae bacterium]|jgi:DUF4097 and DUF4098 domain-containing protein YvlB|nr:hypothetical protein [Gaiellaceae bacterium]
MKRTLILMSLCGALVALAATATASAKNGDIRVAGKCSGQSSSKLKLSEENGRIEVEFEVDQNRNGVRWNVILKRNGSQVARLARVTQAPSGSFTARKLVTNGAGADAINATASRAGETCTAKATFPA